MSFRLFQGFSVQHLRIPPESRERFSDESLCRRCGLCCHSGVTYKGRLILLKDLPCRYLVYESENFTSCMIYERREETGWCNKVSVRNVSKGLFPNDCPYVGGIPNYSGKVVPTEDEFKECLPYLRKVFRNYPQPEYISTPVWNRFLYDVLKLPRRV
jgi:hypothetical protein